VGPTSWLLACPISNGRRRRATYLAWLDCRRLSLGDEPATVFVRHGRVALSPGLDFGPEGAGHVRLNFVTSPEHITDAVSRMVKTVGRSP
jgi:cysteine-S-conjugate beta-lyase